MVSRSGATDGRSVFKCPGKWPDHPSTAVRAARGDDSCPNLASILPEGRKTVNIHPSSGVIRGIPLKINPRHASALYGRGLAKIQTGNAAGGNSDIAAAKRIQPDIVDEFASYGVR